MALLQLAAWFSRTLPAQAFDHCSNSSPLEQVGAHPSFTATLYTVLRGSRVNGQDDNQSKEVWSRVRASNAPENVSSNHTRQLVSAPRRTPGLPSPDGKKFVFSQSSYSFESHSKTSEVVLFDLASGEQTVLSKDVQVSEPKWLGHGNQLVWLRGGENSNTSLVIADADAPGKTYTAGNIAGPVSDLKVCTLVPGLVAIAVAGKANPDGSLFNPKDVPKSLTTAKVYDATFVRHWDSWVSKERNTIFTAVLKKAPARVQGREGRYNLIAFTNALRGTGLECPIPPFGGSDHFDIGRDGLAFVAKDPDLNPSTHTKGNVYFLRNEGLMEMSDPKPRKINLRDFDGAATSPVWAPDGSLAFLQMRTDGYESDKNTIFSVFFGHGSASSDTTQDFIYSATALAPPVGSQDESKLWSLSTSSIVWSLDSKYIYAQAEDAGAGTLWVIPALPDKEVPPRQLTHKNYITEVVPIPTTSKLLVSSTSLVDNSIFYVLDPRNAETTSVVPSPAPQIDINVLQQPSIMHNHFGLSPSQVSSLWWRGDNDYPIHALMTVPSNFDSKKSYPLAYLIHGGPQGAWNDQWSTRWNPALFAEQGYVVICPNPTGSTGYGQSFTDAIKNNWGGSPYIDLEKGFEHIESTLSFVDTDRAVALGASYGGYMMNWIQGQPLGRKFKALVCHDGVLSMTSGQLASEEVYFPNHDLGGPQWERHEEYDKWDPARFTDKWATPMLVIHNELDFRLTIAEGLMAFNVLQGRGIESRFLTFSDEGHWVLKEENALVWWLVVLNWCNRFVGLPEVRDRVGRNGDEFCRQGRRGGAE